SPQACVNRCSQLPRFVTDSKGWSIVPGSSLGGLAARALRAVRWQDFTRIERSLARPAGSVSPGGKSTGITRVSCDAGTPGVNHLVLHSLAAEIVLYGCCDTHDCSRRYGVSAL